MIDRSVARMAALVVCLGGMASPAGAASDLACFAPAGNVGLFPGTCSTDSNFAVGRRPGICVSQTARLRSSAAPFTAVAMMKPAYQNLCFKTSLSAPLSHLALQAEP